jgi:hypothetical protein
MCGYKYFAYTFRKVANLEGPEDKLVAEDSPIRDLLPGRYSKQTSANT